MQNHNLNPRIVTQEIHFVAQDWKINPVQLHSIAICVGIEHAHANEPPRIKSRFALGGYIDRIRHLLVHDTWTARTESIRILVALATAI